MKHLLFRCFTIVALFILCFSNTSQAQTGPTNDSLYIVGSATPGAWSNPISAANVAAQTFTKISATEYKINVLLIGGNEYKFISQNGSWGNNWGIAKVDDPTEINGGPFTFNSQNIKAPAVTGTYTIDVNFVSNFFTVKLASTPKVTISSFLPTSGATGDTITIQGSNFTGATSVSFGGTATTFYSVLNDSTIKAVVGTGANGIVQVIAPNGTGLLSGFIYNSNTLFIVGAATVGGWTNPIPAADSAAQQFTTISKTAYKITLPLTGGKEYKFLPQDGSWIVSYGIAVQDDPTEVNGGAFISGGQNIMAPAATGTYTIDVNFATNTFTVTLVSTPKVNIASFAPTSAAKDSTVTIKGVGFTGATAVSFGDSAAASFTVVNDSTITAVVGKDASGSVKVVAPNGTSSLVGFTFLSGINPKAALFLIGSATANGWINPVPVADSFAQVNANEFKITTHLTSGGEYKFLPTNGSWSTSYGIAVLDDPKEVNGGALVSNGQNILAPSLSGTYTIDVNLSTNNFTVSLVSPDTLFIIGAATVGGWSNPIAAVDSAIQQFTQISPTEYKLTAHITGASEYKFIARNGSWVYNWGIAKADDSTEVNGGSFIFNGQNIMAPTANGTYTFDVNFATDSFSVKVDSLDKVSIASFNPIGGPTDSVITIKGYGFTGATAVSFGGTPALGFLVIDDSTIKAAIGVGASGSIMVVTPSGSASIAGFTYINLTTQTGYIIGAAVAGGWTNPIPSADSVAQKFVQVGPAELRLTTHLIGGAEYKFIPTDGSWANSYGIAVQDDPTMIYGGKLVLNGQNTMSPSLSGTYTIDINIAAQTFTVSLVSPDTLFIVGNATANGWNNPLQPADSAAQQFTQVSPTEYTITVALAADSVYKFLARDNGDWTYNWGVANATDTASIYGGALVNGVNSQNILAPVVNGTYFIDVNFATGLFTVKSTLPVKLASFSAVASGKAVQTTWATATELNVNHFNVQRSTNGNSFTTIATVNAVGSGANTYKFTDATPVDGINYYRLQSVDKNGNFTYSKVVSILYTAASNKFALYPTITHNGIVTIRTNEAVAGKATIKVVDFSGRNLQTSAVDIAQGSNTLSYKLNVAAKGTYIVHVETASGKQSFKVIVE